MKKRGFFITFEGTDGVGKSTQLRLAAGWLNDQDFAVTLTREPGGGPVAEKIREVLLNPSLSMDGLTELFLYEAARVEHVRKIIEPALHDGKIVLCDRFTDATLAYQGHARGLKKQSEMLNKIATGGITPDLTILLDLPPQQGLSKALARNGNKGGDRLENEGLKFQKKVQQGYLALAKKYPKRIKLVKVQDKPQDTHQLIRTIITRSLHGHFGTAARPALFNGRA